METVERPIKKTCPECGAVMNPEHTWIWTAYGATDTENCARLLIDRYVEMER